MGILGPMRSDINPENGDTAATLKAVGKRMIPVSSAL